MIIWALFGILLISGVLMDLMSGAALWFIDIPILVGFIWGMLKEIIPLIGRMKEASKERHQQFPTTTRDYEDFWKRYNEGNSKK